MGYLALLKELDKLGLPKDQYAITSSGPMAIRGIRQTQDIDLIVTDELWKELAKKYPVFKQEGNCKKISLGQVEILGEFTIYKDEEIASTKEQIKTTDIIEGYPFVRLEIIRAFKLKAGREKDIVDIALIDEYLKTTRSSQ